MAGSKIESGLQLFSRLNHRPSIQKLHPVLFSDGGPFPNDFVEITGSSGSGKTLLVMDLLARCILPSQYNGIDLPGKNCGAVIINTDHQFNMLKLISIMELTLKKCDKVFILTQLHLENIIKSSLENLIILNCYDSIQLQMTFHNLEKIISENRNVGLITMDSASSYYWEYRNSVGIISLQSYHLKILGSLHNSTKSSNVVVIYTKSEVEVKKQRNSFTQQLIYKIILEECEQKYQAHVTSKENKKTLPYTIETTVNF